MVRELFVVGEHVEELVDVLTAARDFDGDGDWVHSVTLRSSRQRGPFAGAERVDCPAAGREQEDD